MTDTKKIKPVLLGADLNCYNVARAFHEEYGVTSKAFGHYPVGATQYTRIVDFTAVPELDKEEAAVSVLTEYAKSQPGKTLILIACTDNYAELVPKIAERLKKYYIIPYITAEKMEMLTSKARFYSLCDKYGILYPKTMILNSGNASGFVSGFGYPVIIKPSVSWKYWEHPFPGMKKVYRAENEAEARRIINEIYSSGYPDELIVQDMIPGDDSAMRVLTSYSDTESRVRMMCLGHVLLEEHTPKGLGNHAAIITEPNDRLCESFKKLLEGEGFTGFSNFDIKYDSRDGTYRAFEINVRQGRSNYYVTAAGNNIARYLVSDRVLGEPYTGCHMSHEEIYWRYIPDCVVYRYSESAVKEKIKKLKKAKRAFSSMRYPPDTRFNPRRQFFIMAHEYRHIGKFKKYYRI